MRAPSTPPPRADGSGRQSEQNSGFEEALDSADASTAEAARNDQAPVEGAQPQGGGRPTLSGRGRASADEAGAASTTDETAAEPPVDGTAAMNQIPVAQGPAFALALAALSTSGLDVQTQTQPQTQAQSTADTRAAPASGADALMLVLNDTAPNVKAQGPAMPGQVDPVAEALSLLGLSEDDAAEVQASVSQTTAKVVSQETHLAMSPKSSATMEADVAQSTVLQQAAATGPKVAAGPKAPAEAPTADAAPADATEDVVSHITGAQAGTSTTAFSDDSTDGSSGQDRRQSEGGAAQQSTSGTQTSVPLSSTAGGAMVARSSVADTTTFQSYTDGLSPGSQVARTVTTEIADADRTGTSTDGVLKVLHIELKPQNLGTVSVRMSLKDDVISLHMETSRHETAAAIEKERSALTSALKSAGYVVDEITTQTADPVRASGRIEAASNDASMSSFAQGESQGRSQAQQESSSGRGQNGQRGTGGDVSLTSSNVAGESTDGVSRTRTSGIYV